MRLAVGEPVMNGWTRESFIGIYTPMKKNYYVQILASKVEGDSTLYYVLSLGPKNDEFITQETNIKRLM